MMKINKQVNKELVKGNSNVRFSTMEKVRAMFNTKKLMLVASLLGLLMQGGAVNAQDLPGASPTSYTVTPTGAFRFELPIIAPSGTAGVAPNIRLTFSSNSNNGPLGIGWNLSGLGVIARCSKTIVRDGSNRGVNFDGNDRYCLNGSPLIVVNGVYGAAGSEYRTEIEQFIRIRALGSSGNINGGVSPESWGVWRRDGSYEEYGNSPDSRYEIFDGDNGSRSVLRWGLNKLIDQNDNFYTVSYENSEGLPIEISYTHNTTSSTALIADKKISFNYDDQRSDTTFVYRAGVKITRAKLLESITVTKDSQTIRSYEIGYELGPVSERSRIKSIKECGLSSIECMPPIEFNWDQGQAGFVESESPSDLAPSYLIVTNAIIQGDRIQEQDFNIGEWVDINGDGLLDQVVAMQGFQTPPTSSDFFSYVILKQQDDTWLDDREIGLPSQWRLPRPLRAYSLTLSEFGRNSRFRSNVINYGILKDVNGDGLVDAIYSFDLITDPDQADMGERLTVQETYLNTGDGWESEPSVEYKPKDIMFDYVSNVSGAGTNQARVVTTRSSLIDINGDGLDDWVSAYHVYGANNTSTEHQSTWLNNGNGWDENSTDDYALPDVFVEYDNGFTIEHGRFIDLNGDGLVDWLQTFHKISSPSTLNAWINTGSGWELDNTYALPVPVYANLLPITTSAATVTGSFVDINGDGLTDYMVSFQVSNGVAENGGEATGGNVAWINTGRGWREDEGYRPPAIQIDNGLPFNYGLPIMMRGTYIDMNRDGLVDYVQSYRTRVEGEIHQDTWMNTGSDWQKEPDNSPYVLKDTIIYDYFNIEKYGRLALDIEVNDNPFIGIFDEDLISSLQRSRGAEITSGHLIDINNDGLADWVTNHLPLDREPQKRTKISPENGVERLSSIKTTTGVLIKPTFMPLTSGEDLYIKGQEEPEQGSANAISATYVVSKVETSRPDNNNDFNEVRYQYEGAQINREGRGLLGFKAVTATNVARNTSTYTEYRQDFPFTGLVDRYAVTAGDRTIEATQNEYAFREISFNGTTETSFFPYVTRSTTISDELQSELNVPFSQQVTEYTYDNYGNVLTSSLIVKDAFGSTLNQMTSTTTYDAPDLDNWFLSLISQTIVTRSKPGEDTVVNTLSYDYDVVGQVIKVTREPNSELELDTLFEYDDFGNIIKETLSSTSDGDREVNYSYDSSARFPEMVVNAKGQPVNTEYDFSCDLPSKVTDFNGLSTTIEYDDFCREIKRVGPDEVETLTNYIVADTSNSCFDCQTEPTFIIIDQLEGEPPLETYYNAFNQPLLASTTDMLGDTINSRYEYDYLGRLIRESQPYFSSDLPYYTSYEYDILDRVVKTIFSFLNENGINATQTQAYSVDSLGRMELTSIDTKSRLTTTFNNALGQTVEINYVNNTSLHYEFNAQQSIARTTDAEGNVVSVDYDRLGRRTILDDPDLGLTAYQYNSFGELISQTDAKQQTITYEYDELGRVIEQSVPVVDGSGGISTWVYDQGVNAIGQLSLVTGPNGYSRSYGYDEFARLESDNSVIRGEQYEQRYGYDELGRIAFKQYPESGAGNEFSVHYNYVNGYLASITDRNAGIAGCIEHWRADKYDALGRLAESTLGKIIKTNRDYDPAQGVLNNIESNLLVGNAGLIQDLTYTYDATSNVLSRNDAVLSKDETIEYDSQDRLRFHHIAGGESIEARYNAIGNITYKSNVGTYHYGGDGGPHAVSRVDLPLNAQDSFDRFRVNFDVNGQQISRDLPSIHGQDFSYDDNGNATQSGNRSLYWTAFDKPYLMMAQTANGDQLGSYIEYGADQQRIYKEERTFSSTGQVIGVGERTVYIGVGYQRIRSKSGDITHRYTVGVEGGSVQIDREDGTSHDQANYLLEDNLGSTNVIVNALGEVEQRLAFDPWGMRIDSGDTSSVNSLTNRGFTGHEMDDETGLVNMNARIYDPYLGRFLSADPVLQAPLDMQSYNRYTYVFNNPLKYTDPSGNIAIFASSTNFNFVTNQIGTPSSNAIPSISTSVTSETFRGSFGGQTSLVPGVGRDSEGGLFPTVGLERTPLTSFSITNVTVTLTIDFMNSIGGGGPRGSICIAGTCNLLSTLFGTDGAANNDILYFGDINGEQGRARSERILGNVAARNRAERLRRGRNNGEGRGISDQLDDLQTFLDVAGLFPGLGIFADTANTVIYVFRGDFTGAAISAVAIIPIVGQVATGAKLADKAVDVAKQCFVAGTPVHTKEGVKPIEEIQVGDLVASKNDKTGEIEWKPVVKLFENPDKTILNISFVSLLGETETLGTTEEHPFWVESKGWTNAGDLAIGDEITTLRDGLMKVSTIATSSEKQTTYNFEVEDFHTYFVGDVGLWVHNTCAGQFVFRGDSRSADEIFEEGFQPFGTNTDLRRHVIDNPQDSIFVSTSKSAEVAERFEDSVFVIRTPTNAVDVNKSIRDNPFADELEVAIPGGVDSSDIRGVTLTQEGVSILNPNFVP